MFSRHFSIAQHTHLLWLVLLLLLLPAASLASATNVTCNNTDVVAPPNVSGVNGFELVLSGHFTVLPHDCGSRPPGTWYNSATTGPMAPAVTYNAQANQTTLWWLGSPTSGPHWHVGFELIGPTNQVAHGLPPSTTLWECWTTGTVPGCNPGRSYTTTPMITFSGGNQMLPPQYFSLNWVINGVMQWSEVQMPNGAIPSVQWLNTSTGSLTVSGAGTLVSNTYYPLDQLNFQDLPPSDFTPDPSVDGVVPFNSSPEPGTLALFGSGVVGLSTFLRKRLLSRRRS
jgi:hypothetical protein